MFGRGNAMLVERAPPPTEKLWSLAAAQKRCTNAVCSVGCGPDGCVVRETELVPAPGWTTFRPTECPWTQMSITEDGAGGTGDPATSRSLTVVPTFPGTYRVSWRTLGGAWVTASYLTVTGPTCVVTSKSGIFAAGETLRATITGGFPGDVVRIHTAAGPVGGCGEEGSQADSPEVIRDLVTDAASFTFRVLVGGPVRLCWSRRALALTGTF